MSAARHSSLTAAAAAALLAALWFVPDAHATTGTATPAAGTRPAGPATLTAPDSSAAPGTTPGAPPAGRLADTGSFDTTPYLIAGTAFLGLGAAFVAYSIRRDHAEYEADPELAGA